MKSFNTKIPDPLDPNGTTMLTQDYHLGPPVTEDFLFTRYGIYFQLIKQDYGDKKIVSSMPSCHGSSSTAIRIWYQSVTIHYETHKIYVT